MEETKKEMNEEMQLVIFRLGGEEFAVNIQQVREIVRMIPITPIPRSPEFIKGVVNLRGQVLIIMELAKRLGLPMAEHNEKTRIVVAEVEEGAIGMIVDDVTEVLRLPLNRIEKAPEMLDTDISKRYITGIGKLEDRLLILIDLGAILSEEEIEHAERLKNEQESVKKPDNQ